MTKAKYGMPCPSIQRSNGLYKDAKRYINTRNSNDPDLKNHYERFNAHTQKVDKDAYWKHISNIFPLVNDSSDPDSNKTDVLGQVWYLIVWNPDLCRHITLREIRIWDHIT